MIWGYHHFRKPPYGVCNLTAISKFRSGSPHEKNQIPKQALAMVQEWRLSVEMSGFNGWVRRFFRFEQIWLTSFYNLFDLQGFSVNLWMSFWVFFVWKDKLPNFKFGWCFSKHAAAIFWSFCRPLEELEVKFTWRLTPKQKIMHTKWMNIWGSWWCFANTMGIPSFSMTQRPRGRWTNPKTPWGTSGGVHTCWPFQRDSWWLVMKP